ASYRKTRPSHSAGPSLRPTFRGDAQFLLPSRLRSDENDRAIYHRRRRGEDLGLKRRFQILDLRPIGVVVDGHQPQWRISRVPRERGGDIMGLLGASFGFEA